MDVNSIRAGIRAFFQSLGGRLREMWKLPYVKLYLAAAVVLTLVFFVMTFPYELLIREQFHNLEKSMGRSIAVGEIDFSLFGNSEIDSIVISLQDGELVLKDIKFNIAINPYTTLVKKTLRGMISIQDFRYTLTDTTVTAALKSDFDLAFPESGPPADGFLKLELNNAFLKGIKIKDFDVPPIKFSSIRGDSTIQRGNLRLASMKIAGPDLQGNIHGMLSLAKGIASSNLNLTIELDPDSRVLEDYAILLGGAKKNGENLKITLTGPLKNPKATFPWTKGGKEKEKDRPREKGKAPVPETEKDQPVED
ncbi:MAG: type II secretion system protein GspN [Spirochaetes bacterium]|nr:MAG: type II secretion system protein GspN [Spirochaetota bacterium]